MSDAPLVYRPDSKIVPREELEVIVNATQYDQQARKRLSEIEKLATETREAAQQEGYAAGLAAGREEAISALNQGIVEVRNRFMALESELEDVVVNAVEKIIGTLGERDSASRALREALLDLTDGMTASLRVPPDEVHAVKADVAKISQGGGYSTVTGVEGDPLLKPGEMLLVTPQGRVHIGIRQQVARLRSTMSARRAAE